MSSEFHFQPVFAIDEGLGGDHFKVAVTFDTATRFFRVLDRRSDFGRTRIQIECPFCKTRFWAYVWSISGGGKKCENKSCGAMHTSFGHAWPVAGREPN